MEAALARVAGPSGRLPDTATETRPGPAHECGSVPFVSGIPVRKTASLQCPA
jgi:hypothetical protein